MLGDDAAIEDPYVSFGIGIPLVRYWLQESMQAHQQVLAGYQEIEFDKPTREEDHKETEKTATPPRVRTAGLFPSFG